MSKTKTKPAIIPKSNTTKTKKVAGYNVQVKQNNAVEFHKAGDTFYGKLLDVKEGIGKYETRLWLFEDQNGVERAIFGSTILDRLLLSIHMGAQVQIIFKGLGERKNKSQNPPKLFDVFVKSKEDLI